MFQGLSKGRFWFLFFVNLFTLEQIFAVVKIRHSSLILKEVLHLPTQGVGPQEDWTDNIQTVVLG